MEASADPGSTLDLEQLRAALNSLIDLAAERFGTAIDLHRVTDLRDYYWQLPVQEALTMVDNPGQHITAGQTSDDLSELDGMTAEPDEQVLWHSATHLSELIRVIAFLDLPR